MNIIPIVKGCRLKLLLLISCSGTLPTKKEVDEVSRSVCAGNYGLLAKPRWGASEKEKLQILHTQPLSRTVRRTKLIRYNLSLQ